MSSEEDLSTILQDDLKSELFDPNYKVFISQKMRVPERIKVDGSSDTSYHTSALYANEVFDMRVPERILVAGNDQHVASKGIPREIEFENTVLPPDRSTVRVKTPPRVIRLDEHHFPSAFDFESEPREQSKVLVKPKPRYPVEQRLINRESTPPIGGEGLTPSEEITHLRRQMAKLNRRIMAIELENIQRQQREKIVYAVGLTYFLLKVIMWMNRSS